MSALEVVSLIAMVIVTAGGAVYAVQWVKSSGWSDRLKWWVSLVICGVFGLASSWLAGDVLELWNGWGGLTSAQAYAYAASVVVVAKAFYHSYVKPKAAKPS